MNQNQREEEKLAQQTVECLESSTGGQLSGEDRQVFELGNLMRQTASTDLPESDPELRQHLLDHLDDAGAKQSLLPQTSLNVYARRIWAIAAVLVLGIGAAWSLYPLNPIVRQTANSDGLKYQQLGDGILHDTTPASMRNESPTRSVAEPGKFVAMGDVAGVQVIDEYSPKKSQSTTPRPRPYLSSSAQKDHVNASKKKTPWVDLPNRDDWYVKKERRKKYEAIKLKVEPSIFTAPESSVTMLNGQSSSEVRLSNENNSVVQVPDGGTVLLGGVKQMPGSDNPGVMISDGAESLDAVARDMSEPQPTTDYYSRFKVDMGSAIGRYENGDSEGEGRAMGRGGGRGGLGGGGLGGGGLGGGMGRGGGPVDRFRNNGQSNTEHYAPIHENKFIGAIGGNAISTFAIDVDTAAYANMRRFLNSGQLPPRDSIRIEELVNYFQYDYPQPQGDDPFSVNMELATCPWNNNHKLLRVGLKGKDVHVDERPATNLVFLLDVSGSMNSEDKLPLLKRGFQMMVNKLTENDRVSIVTYAGNAGVALEPISGDQKKKINEAIELLTPGGSTHGSAGIELAYKLAQTHFIKDGVNKVILATDGDLNVGITEDSALVKLIKQKASEDVFLTVLGFGTGNLKDAKMEQLADNGNGMYAYIDSIREAHKVLVEQMSGSLVTIAKDVKIQIEFNPAEVKAYRLIGYENRMLATKDFDDDKKDAGEIGAGHTVTAIYELVTTDRTNEFSNASKTDLKYQSDRASEVENDEPETQSHLSPAAKSGELLTLALRYKQPDANTSKRIEFTIKNDEKSFASASDDFRFAASVASFGMLLRGSQHAGDADPGMIQEIATGSLGDDRSGYRAEFLDLVRKAGVVGN